MNLLICGLGSIGRRHLQILKNSGNHRFTAFRSNKGLLQDGGIVDDEIFDISEISKHKFDGALITNPTSLHVQSAITIAKNDIPMFIEKPLGKNSDGTEELYSLVKAKNLPVLMGYNLLYHPAILLIKKFLNENIIGKVIAAKAQFGTYMPGWHKDEDYKKSYAANASMGGGVVLTSIHEQNYLTDMFGEIIDIKAMEVGGDVIGIDAEEGVEILLKHESGVISNIHLNFFQKPYYRNCEIIGTEGTIYWDFMIPEIRIMKKDKTQIHKLGDDPIELLNESYINQMKHFTDVLEKKAEPRIPLEKGIDDMKTALKILKEIGRNYN